MGMVEQGESVIDWRQKSDEAFALVKLLRNASKIDKGKRRRPAVSAEVKSKGSPHERAHFRRGDRHARAHEKWSGTQR